LRWLHISDLHYEPEKTSFDTEKMLEKLKETLENDCDSVDDVFFSGDFRFALNQDTTEEVAIRAACELIELADMVGVTDPDHIHIVPGNHDLERKNISILKEVVKKYNKGSFEGTTSVDGMDVCCREYLLNRFEFFDLIVNKLDNSVWTNMSTGLIHRAYDFGDYAVVYLNTAIASGIKNERGTLLIGYNDLFESLKAIPKGKPIIALGHHGLECLSRGDRRRVEMIFNDYGIRLYLCGDEHMGAGTEINGIVQITSGCLKITNGVEQTFYIGELCDNGGVAIKAYTYDTEHFGWNFSRPFTEDIARRVKHGLKIVEEKHHTISKKGFNIFLSYSHEDASLADSIDTKFAQSGIQLIRDKRDIDYRESKSDFKKQIRFNDYVILVISPNYLKSADCMYEILELTKDENHKKRILPIMKRDTDILTPIGRNSYVIYWQDEYKKLYNSSDMLDPLNRSGAIPEILRYERIMRELPIFLHYLADIDSIICDGIIDDEMFARILSILK